MTWPTSQFLKLLSNRAFSHDGYPQGFHHLYLRGSLVSASAAASADEAVNGLPEKEGTKILLYMYFEFSVSYYRYVVHYKGTSRCRNIDAHANR